MTHAQLSVQAVAEMEVVQDPEAWAAALADQNEEVE